MKYTSLTAALLLWTTLLTAPLALAAPFDHDHSLLARVLQEHVRDGRVDYAALKNDRAPLDAYVRTLATVDAAQLAAFSRQQQLAYWINAYNAFTLTTIIENYPIRGRSLVGLAFPSNSIWQIPGAFKGDRFTAGGRTLSLDDLEHKIVRPTFNEPRIHMALVCAARGCPVLRSNPYRAAALDSQLDEQSRRYLADTTHGARLDADKRVLYVSSIFKWFDEDFAALGQGDSRRGILEFVARHGDSARAAALREGKWRLRYLDYDWNLNE
ncbi:MAG TPA: DUF547 domain-containing protein [Steroidobacteraceae bacterium]|nr:DUF547 domain-containing protein [Steroidobacteraceae bacterium]HRX87977.1 DUF547 domain-containing protein [Steroidobacteraceae bacterium]